MYMALDLAYIKSLRAFLSNMLSDMCITHPHFDTLQNVIGGLSKVIANPEKYATR